MWEATLVSTGSGHRWPPSACAITIPSLMFVLQGSHCPVSPPQLPTCFPTEQSWPVPTQDEKEVWLELLSEGNLVSNVLPFRLYNDFRTQIHKRELHH